MTMAMGDDDNNVDGDGAMGNEVDDDGNFATGNEVDDDGDGATGDDNDGRRQWRRRRRNGQWHDRIR